MKKIVSSILLLIIFSLGAATVFATQYTSSNIRFNETKVSALLGSFGAINNTTSYPGVNSKWNQPRHSGTNPHQGTDFNLTYGQKFVLPYAGFIVQSNGLTGKDANFIVMLDVNGNKIKDDSVWLDVWHTQIDSNISLNTWYQKGTTIATVQQYLNSNGTRSDHLHFGTVHDTSYQIYGPMHTYYWNVAYNSGRDLDIISYVSSGGYQNSILTFNAYIKNNTNTEAPNNIVIFHRKSGTTTWKRTSVPVNTTTPSAAYSINWTSSGYGYAAGDTIQYMIRLGRYSGYNDTATSWDYYNWAFYPAKYERPTPAPDSSTAAPQPSYATVTLSF